MVVVVAGGSNSKQPGQNKIRDVYLLGSSLQGCDSLLCKICCCFVFVFCFFFNSPWAKEMCSNISRQANVLSLSWAPGEADWQTVTCCDSSQHLDGLAEHAALFTWAREPVSSGDTVCGQKTIGGEADWPKVQVWRGSFVLLCLSHWLASRARLTVQSWRFYDGVLINDLVSAIVTMWTGQSSLDQWYLYKTTVSNNSSNINQWLQYRLHPN